MADKARTLTQIDPGGLLQTEFLGTTYGSPLVVASGTLVEQYGQIAPYLDEGAAGAVIPRSTRLEMTRTVHPSPHLYQTGKGSGTTMLNGEWTGADVTYWRPHLEAMAKDGRVIMSVSGRDIPGCVVVCKELDRYGFPLFEVNISCGVSQGVHGFITRSAEHIKQLVSELKEAGIKTPIALKLGHSDGIVELAGVAKEAGADAITAINTYGPVFDFRIGADGKPERVIGAVGAKGGMSGSSLFHTALTDVADISRDVKIPVLASGGVMTAEQAAKMIMAGASIVQLYTVLHEKGVRGPEAMNKFTRDMVVYMLAHSLPNVSEIRGSALPLMEQPTQLRPQIPIVKAAGCIGCDACVRVCLPKAFDSIPANNKVGHVVGINEQCVGCGHCVTQCPVPGVLSMPATS